jgi:hypothetical protein
LLFGSVGLERYLYGLSGRPGKLTSQGYLPILRTLKVHRVGRKTIPSGFFNLDGAENVSAVIFSNSGTLAKFDRMAVQADPEEHVLYRFGQCADPHPTALRPASFRYRVGHSEFEESWVHGLNVFHNPRALHPLARRTFGQDAYEVFFENGTRWEYRPRFHVFSSQTMRFSPRVKVKETPADGHRTQGRRKMKRKV